MSEVLQRNVIVDDSVVFSPPEVAQKLGMSWLTVYTWLHGTSATPPLPYTSSPYGTKAIRYAIEESALIEWLKENRPEYVETWKQRRT